MSGDDGSRTNSSYWLITNADDHRRHPAVALVRPYHERWRSSLFNDRLLEWQDF